MSKGLPSCVFGHKDIVHDCEVPLRLECSKTVFLHKIGWSRMGDVNTPHRFGPKCKSTHSMPIAKGSSTVFVNKVGAGRITDKVAGCTAVAQGFRDILTGPP